MAHTCPALPCPACSHGMFTHEGPSEQQMKETVFQFTNVAKGYSKGRHGEGGEGNTLPAGAQQASPIGT